MNRRKFLHNLFASTATVVVAPEIALECLDAVTHKRQRSYFDNFELMYGDDIDLWLREQHDPFRLSAIQEEGFVKIIRSTREVFASEVFFSTMPVLRFP